MLRLSEGHSKHQNFVSGTGLGLMGGYGIIIFPCHRNFVWYIVRECLKDDGVQNGSEKRIRLEYGISAGMEEEYEKYMEKGECRSDDDCPVVGGAGSAISECTGGI